MGDDKKCVVCGSVKTIYRNCGVLTCNKCVAFFRTAIIGGYLKPCIVKSDKCTENCRSCRLQKCLNMGMDARYIGAKERNSCLPKEKVATECKICEKVNVLGYSYGVLSCRGCQLFFKRASTGEVNIDSCDIENGKCVKDNCKSCRLKNCRKEGMVFFGDVNPKNRVDVKRIDQALEEEANSSGTNTENNDFNQTEPECDVGSRIDEASVQALVADEGHSPDTVKDYRNQVDDTESTDVLLNISQSEIHLKSIQKYLEELKNVISDFQEREEKYLKSEKEYQMRENIHNKKIQKLQSELEISKELTDKLQKDLQEATVICENQKTDLLTAVQTQSLDAIRNIVEQKGIPIDDKWTDYAVLVEALKIGKSDVAKYLLERNCRVNKTETSSTPADTPLHHAVKLKETDLVEYLLKKKASIDIVNAEGDSPLHLAFIYEQSNIVDLLLAYMKKYQIYINPVNQQGLSHLHIACAREDKEIIKQLLAKGASVSQSVNENSMLWSGYTAMHFAVHFRSIEAAKIMTSAVKKLEKKLELTQKNDIEGSCTKLLQKDTEKSFAIAGLNSLNNSGKLLALAIMRMNTERDIDRSICPFSPLHLAIESDCTGYVELELMGNADIDDCHYDIMPLHLALYREETSQSKKIVNIVYEAAKKTEKNHTDVNGLSYLHVAVTRNDLATVKHYLDAGNNVNSQVTYAEKQFYHFSPLHFAMLYESKEMAKLLINHGANVNQSDDGKHGTPLHMAIAAGNVELVELLLKSGADVEAVQPKDHQTVLHKLMHCLRHKKEDDLLRYINCFVQMGCDINAQDINGDTALSYCDMYDDNFSLECLMHLLDSGADINLLNCFGDTPLERMSSDGRDNCKFIMELYLHTENLKALGTMLRPKNVEICQKYLEKIKNCKKHAEEFGEMLHHAEKERLHEIAKLQKPFNSNCRNSSLYLLLNSDPKFVNTNFPVSFLQKIIEDRDFEKNYPFFGYLIRLQCQRIFQSQGIKMSVKRVADEQLDNEQQAKQLCTK